MRITSILFLFLCFSSCQKEETSDIKFPDSSNYYSFSASSYVELTGRVWEDLDGDGLQDVMEAGVRNYTIVLHNWNGQALRSIKTDVDGSYNFKVLKNVNFYIEAKPNNQDFLASPPNVLIGINSIDSDLTGQNGLNTTDFFETTEDMDLDFGFYKSNEISGSVWMEKSGHDNNLLDDMDELIENCIVKLIKIDLSTGLEEVLQIQTSDTDGKFKFGQVPSGFYYLDFSYVLINNLLFVSPLGNDIERSSKVLEISNECGETIGFSGFVELGTGEIKDGLNCGFRPPHSGIGSDAPNGFVWLDENRNGTYEFCEEKLSGIQLHLIDVVTGTIKDQAVTGYYGTYTFNDFPQDGRKNYIKLNLEPEYKLTSFNASNLLSDNPIDSDFSKSECRTRHFYIHDETPQFNAGVIEL